MNKKLSQVLKGHKVLVFMDYEGTQFSHEMIAIGAILVVIDQKTGRIKRKKAPFKTYVKAHNKIGSYVEKLTGINEEFLKQKAVSFDAAMKAFKSYCGLNFKKATFITYGNHDMRILGQSIAYNLAYPKEVTSQIQKNYFDYSAFIGEFIRDEKGNPLSLLHLCELFQVPEAGTAHDPEIDAINLANLYDAFIVKKDLVLDEYRKHIKTHSNSLPTPIHNIVVKLASGENVTAEEFDEELKKYIN